MKDRTDLKITVILGLLGGIAFALVPQNWIFNEHIICPTRWLFHVPCPLCGMTRAAWLLVHLQWKEAWYYNPGIFPLAVIFCLMIVAAFLPAVAKQRRVRGGQGMRILKWSVWGGLGLIVIFYLWRMIWP
ncbi:MAG: DUF2752 domain-containing protein [Bacteroidales bacterium]